MTEISWPYPVEYDTLDPNQTALPLQPTSIQHNWLYSFVPASIWLGEAGALAAFLTGYCKQCDTGFSVWVPTEREISFKKLGVPKFGCSNDRS